MTILRIYSQKCKVQDQILRLKIRKQKYLSVITKAFCYVLVVSFSLSHSSHIMFIIIDYISSQLRAIEQYFLTTIQNRNASDEIVTTLKKIICEQTFPDNLMTILRRIIPNNVKFLILNFLPNFVVLSISVLSSSNISDKLSIHYSVTSRYVLSLCYTWSPVHNYLT